MPCAVRSVALLLAIAATASACAGSDTFPSPSTSSTAEATMTTFSLSSTAFADGAAIPRRYTCQGEDPSPPLAWSGAPAGTAAFALIVDDPDASGWIHWLTWDLPGTTVSLAEGASGSLEAREGPTSWGTVGWRGPCPPSGTHRYVFRLLALSAPLGLPPGAEVTAVRRAAAGVTLAEATLTGTYRKS